MSEDCIVEAENLSKHFFVLQRGKTIFRTFKVLIKPRSFKREFWALLNLSFKVKRGEKLAVIGINGSGKTTLLRILTGIYDKTCGYFNVKEQPRALFKFWMGFNYDLSVIENIYLFGVIHGIRRNILKQNMHNILEMSDLQSFRFAPLKDISMGQQQRLAFSVFAQNTSDFLIFDDSLVFVDQAFVKKCETYFQSIFSSEKTLIVSSHDNLFLKKYCKTAMWLDEGRIRMFGEAREVINAYERSFSI